MGQVSARSDPPIGMGDDSLKDVLRWLEPKYSRDGIQVPRDPDSDDLVRPLLDAGVDALLERFINYQDSGVEAYTNANEILGVSLATVMAHFDSRGGTRRSHRDRIMIRWKTSARYQRDLLRYVYRPWLHGRRMAEATAALGGLLDMPFGVLVETLAKSETDLVQCDPIIQLRVVLQTAFPSDPEIVSLTTEWYSFLAEGWAGLYEIVSDAYGLDLSARSGLTYLDIAHIFGALVEGSYNRRAANPSLGTLSSGAHIAVYTIQMLLSQITGLSWDQLSVLTAKDRQSG